MNIFLDDYVRIVENELYDGEYGKVEAYDGFMFYTIKLLTKNKTIKCSEGELKKLSEEEKLRIIEEYETTSRKNSNIKHKQEMAQIESIHEQKYSPGSLEEFEGPRIVVMNINPENINSCVDCVIHGARENTRSVGVVDRLARGDICLIRKTSGGGTRRYGVVGIWYYQGCEDIEGLQESLWIPSTGWKYKILMRPLVKEFDSLFEEDFSLPVPGQLRHKESSKVKGLRQTGIQGAVTIPRDQKLLRRYLKAIITEKKEECDQEVLYEDELGNRYTINVYDFLSDLTRENRLYP